MIVYKFHKASFRHWLKQVNVFLVDMDEINIDKH